MTKLRISICLIASLGLSACTIHHPDIQQGNVLETENVDKLKEGMDKSQVRFLMGTPMVQDPFHANRWDYVYSYEIVGEQKERGRVSITFENDKVKSIEKLPVKVVEKS